MRNLSAENNKRKKRSSDPSFNPPPLDYLRAMKNGYHYYITAELPEQRITQPFTVGDNKTYGGYYNAPLVTGNTYEIYIRAISVADGETAIAYTKIDSPIVVKQMTDSDYGIDSAGVITGIAAFIVVIIIVIVVIILFLLRKKRNKKVPLDDDEEQSVKLTDVNSSGLSNGQIKDIDSDSLFTDDLSGASHEDVDPVYGNIDASNIRKPIKVTDLADFIEEKRKSSVDGFKAEYVVSIIFHQIVIIKPFIPRMHTWSDTHEHILNR